MGSFGSSVQPEDDNRFIPTPPRRSPGSEASSRRPSTGRSIGRSPYRLLALLVIALIAGIVVWLVAGKSGNSSKSSSEKTAVASEQGLQKLVSALGETVFWVGPEQGVRYGIEQRSSGQVYVRYLTEKMKADTTTTLTIGSYPMNNAYAQTVAWAKTKGWKRLATGVGGVTAYTISSRDVYFVQPDLNYQIEVFDPTPGRAAALVQSGRALPVTKGERLGLTLAALRAKVASLGTTVYWIGPKSGVTYEFMRNPGGNIYLRYLPKGVAVGASGGYLTVGTYPMAKAAATTRVAGGRAGAVRVNLAGAEAFYAKAKPTNVYVAFTGSDYQIEVYNPVAARALTAVESGQLTPVS